MVKVESVSMQSVFDDCSSGYSKTKMTKLKWCTNKGISLYCMSVWKKETRFTKNIKEW